MDAKDIADNFQIQFSPAFIGIYSLIALLTIGSATLIPVLYVTRLNPKKILT